MKGKVVVNKFASLLDSKTRINSPNRKSYRATWGRDIQLFDKYIADMGMAANTRDCRCMSDCAQYVTVECARGHWKAAEKEFLLGVYYASQRWD